MTGNWNTWAMLRSSVGEAGDVAAVEQDPALGSARRRPEMMLSSVVLPQPDGPSSA